MSFVAQIASSLLAAEIGGLEAQCEHKVRHSRELAMSWRRECDEAEAAAALGTARAEAAAREAEAALETARAEAVALRTALERERLGASEREQRAARDLDEMTSSRLELQMTISRLEHQLTEQRQQLTEQLTEQRQQSEREWSEGTAMLRAQLELKWRSHIAREIAGRETAAQAAPEHAVGESGTALIATEGR